MGPASCHRCGIGHYNVSTSAMQSDLTSMEVDVLAVAGNKSIDIVDGLVSIKVDPGGDRKIAGERCPRHWNSLFINGHVVGHIVEFITTNRAT